MGGVGLFRFIARQVVRELLEEAVNPGQLEARLDQHRAKKAARRERRSENMSKLGAAIARRRDESTREAEREQAFRAAEEGADGAIPFEWLRARYSSQAIALVRPYPPHREPAGRSRIGGLPDLPADIPWPRSADGPPLHFLAQVDLAELPRLSGEIGNALPLRGTLLFFARMDEELIVDEGDSVRVLFDPASQARAVPPPADLPNLDPRATNPSFAVKNGRGTNLFPSWPLKPVLIESLPDPTAFHPNAHSLARYADYVPDLQQFRIDEIERASGLCPAPNEHWPDLGIFDGKTPREAHQLKPFVQSGFPWTARGIALVAQSVIEKGRRRTGGPDVDQLADWRDRAGARSPADPVGAVEAKRFIAELNALMAADTRAYVDKDGVERMLYRDEVRRAIDVAVHRLIAETGGDPRLAAALRDALYAAAYPRHAPVTSSNVQKVRHAQMFGYVPSAQAPLAADARTLTLLQLQSDPGLDMIIGDMGELDFRIEPEALARRDWSRVTLHHTGH